jgi:3-keto-L-gulonate-6-phosphate decarboxylase
VDGITKRINHINENYPELFIIADFKTQVFGNTSQYKSFFEDLNWWCRPRPAVQLGPRMTRNS